jgi:glycosyltransferase involved in cell wall biosynthesis
MRIVLDMQGAQTESRYRGIGRHTLALAQAMVRNRGEHEIILVLSGLFPETIEPTRGYYRKNTSLCWSYSFFSPWVWALTLWMLWLGAWLFLGRVGELVDEL